MLAYLRKGETFAELAAGFCVGTTTAWRYVTETGFRAAARRGARPDRGPDVAIIAELARQRAGGPGR